MASLYAWLDSSVTFLENLIFYFCEKPHTAATELQLQLQLRDKTLYSLQMTIGKNFNIKSIWGVKSRNFFISSCFSFISSSRKAPSRQKVAMTCWHRAYLRENNSACFVFQNMREIMHRNFFIGERTAAFWLWTSLSQSLIVTNWTLNRRSARSPCGNLIISRNSLARWRLQ